MLKNACLPVFHGFRDKIFYMRRACSHFFFRVVVLTHALQKRIMPRISPTVHFHRDSFGFGDLAPIHSRIIEKGSHPGTGGVFLLNSDSPFLKSFTATVMEAVPGTR